MGFSRGVIAFSALLPALLVPFLIDYLFEGRVGRDSFWHLVAVRQHPNPVAKHPETGFTTLFPLRWELDSNGGKTVDAQLGEWTLDRRDRITQNLHDHLQHFLTMFPLGRRQQK